MSHCMDCGAAAGALHHKNCASFERDALPDRDPSAHYRHTLRAAINDDDISRGYVEIKADPYRIADLYRMQGGPREQILKKCLRWTDKGQTEDEVIGEIESALARWKELREEDRRVPL